MLEASGEGDGGEDDDGEGLATGGAFGAETELLERVVKKMAVLTEITMKKSAVDAETMEQLGEGDRAVLQQATEGQGGDRSAKGPGGVGSDDTEEDDGGLDEERLEYLIQAQQFALESAGLETEVQLPFFGALIMHSNLCKNIRTKEFPKPTPKNT